MFAVSCKNFVYFLKNGYIRRLIVILWKKDIFWLSTWGLQAGELF
jgi:hypothetical protein